VDVDLAFLGESAPAPSPAAPAAPKRSSAPRS
jgi:hypothetical protein